MGWGGEQMGEGRGADWWTWEVKYTFKTTKSHYIPLFTSSFFFYKQSLISKLIGITKEMETFSKNKNIFWGKNYIDSELIVLQNNSSMRDSQQKGGLKNYHCLKLTWKTITREWQNTSTGDAWYQTKHLPEVCSTINFIFLFSYLYIILQHKQCVQFPLL